MDKEKISQFLRKNGKYYLISMILGGLLMAVSLAGIVWMANNNQRTIFGEKLNWIEKSISADKKEIQKVIVSNEKEKILKESSLKYLGLSLGQNFVIRQLIDLGFLGFLFWDGLFILGFSIYYKKFTKKIENLINEANP